MSRGSLYFFGQYMLIALKILSYHLCCPSQWQSSRSEIVKETQCLPPYTLKGSQFFELENLKTRVRQSLFWPIININSEIEDMIKKSSTCLTICNQQTSELGIKHPVLQEPWIKLAGNLFRLYGHWACMDTIIYWQQITIPNSLPSRILKTINPLPLLTSVRKYFCNMVFLRN